MKKNILIVFLMIVIFILGAVLIVSYSKKNNLSAEFVENRIFQSELENAEEEKLDDLNRVWSRGKCEGQGIVEFGTLPMKPEDFSIYLPYGMLADAHVTPIDHGYFSPAVFHSPQDAYEVRAIADGTIVQIGTRDRVVGDENHNQAKAVEYRIDIEHTCTLYSYFDLITSLAPDIKEKLDKAGGKFFSGRIPIKEGQLIGRIGGQTLDFAVYNNDVRLGFINPKSYIGEAWKIHTDDPYKYFKEPAKSILASKNPRTAQPRAGKIDYDIAGRAIGNWFAEGTAGYQGINRDRYWDGHLALVPDFLDPSQIRFSIGNFGGVAKQFGVKTNQPDPAIIDVSTGLVKYELVQYEYIDKDTKQRWNQMEKVDNGVIGINQNYVQGVALVQVLEGEKLKVEVFPEKTAEQVTSFTNGAKIYTR
ncbi:MAG: hypothetical protein ACD_11C00105G0010 [uncultured bacterium]|nr:MAG: hypothetical protein ACD_11C00105G0010 [uncultured bacterium]HBR71361.1 hypothetical protein [Candidatus Moranbacteria bacterium]